MVTTEYVCRLAGVSASVIETIADKQPKLYKMIVDGAEQQMRLQSSIDRNVYFRDLVGCIAQNFSVGEKLPAIKKLEPLVKSIKHKSSKPSINEEIKRLEAFGYVYTKQRVRATIVKSFEQFIETNSTSSSQLSQNSETIELVKYAGIPSLEYLAKAVGVKIEELKELFLQHSALFKLCIDGVAIPIRIERDILRDSTLRDVISYISRNYKVGDEVPSERDLEIETNYARTAIRVQLKRLENYGYLGIRQGVPSTMLKEFDVKLLQLLP